MCQKYGQWCLEGGCSFWVGSMWCNTIVLHFCLLCAPYQKRVGKLKDVAGCSNLSLLCSISEAIWVGLSWADSSFFFKVCLLPAVITLLSSWNCGEPTSLWSVICVTASYAAQRNAHRGIFDAQFVQIWLIWQRAGQRRLRTDILPATSERRKWKLSKPAVLCVLENPLQHSNSPCTAVETWHLHSVFVFQNVFLGLCLWRWLSGS